ncbi:MAG: ATPase [Deltaproteobacteria bacterium]|nr:ATPase [Deltaproteobacteria bacterium]
MTPIKAKSRIRLLLGLPEALLIIGFGGVIILGTLLLRLPWTHQPGKVSFLNALFTSTSAVCVTGLTVVDTGTDFTRFGQIVILLLIQAGGLGIMTFAALMFQFLGRRLSLRSQSVLHGSFFQQDIGVNFKTMFRRILWLTAVTELLGVAVLFAALLPQAAHLGETLFQSVFHAVSAFCNAGFSLYKDNLVEVRHNHLFTIAIMGLIVIGGLGHTVVHELWQRAECRFSRRRDRDIDCRRLSVHARVVLRFTAILIVGGAAVILVLGLTAAETSWEARLAAALFQSITARTAGFNTVDIGRLPLASLLLISILMFIGGSPASCAGGIKTTVFAISWAELRARVRGETEVRLLDRRIPNETLWRVSLLLRLALLWNIVGVLLLLVTEGARPGIGMHDVIFEQISAFGTVGLSTGITDKLSAPGKLWIIATMFVGRLGPLTLAMWFFTPKPGPVQYPEGKVMIG